MADATPDPTPAPKPRKRRVLRVVVVVGLLAFAWPAFRGTWTEAERTDATGLVRGDVDSRLIRRDGESWIQISALVEAPIAQVWKVVHDHERMTDFMPRMAKLKVLEKSDTHKRVRIDFHFLTDRYTEIDVDIEVGDRERVERWKRFGGSLPVNEGRWVLVPIDASRTFARYEVHAESGMPVPAFLERAILRDALKVVLTRVEDRIERLRREDPAYLNDAK